MSTHSPADVLRHALIAAGAGTLPTLPAGAWPIYVGHMPDAPDNAICIYDTAGRRDGRLMGTGESITHPGFQAKVRATSHATAWAKAGALQAALDGLLKTVVAIAPESYNLQAVSQTGALLSMGQEPAAKRREQVTLNGTLTFTQV